jgi:hypothetical protein
LTSTDGLFGTYNALHLIDLADGSRRTMPWDEERQIGVIAVYGGTVYFSHDGATMTWTPGTEPEPAGLGLRWIDPLSGTSLRVEDRQGVIVDRPDGTRQRVVIDQGVALAPGGTALYSFRSSPPAITLFELSDIESAGVLAAQWQRHQLRPAGLGGRPDRRHQGGRELGPRPRRAGGAARCPHGRVRGRPAAGRRWLRDRGRHTAAHGSSVSVKIFGGQVESGPVDVRLHRRLICERLLKRALWMHTCDW